MQLTAEQGMFYSVAFFCLASTVSNAASNIVSFFILGLLIWMTYKKGWAGPKNLLLYMGVYVASLLIPAILSPTPVHSLEYVFNYSKSLIFFFAPFYFQWTHRRWNLCIWLLAVGLLANDILAFWQWHIGVPERPVGFAGAALGMLSGYFVFLLPLFFLLVLLDGNLSMWLKRFLWILLPVSLFVMFLNGIKMVWITVFFAIIGICLWQLRKKANGKKFLISILIIFLGIGSLAVFFDQNRQIAVSRAIMHPESFMHERSALWGAAWHIFSKHPLIGVGAGNYGNQKNEYILTNYDFNQINMNIVHAHNIELHILAEQGIVGLIGLLVLGYGIVKSSCQQISYLEQPMLGIAPTCLLLCLIFASQSDYILWYRPIMRLFWFLLGLFFMRNYADYVKNTCEKMK